MTGVQTCALPIFASIFQNWGIRFKEVKDGNEAIAEVQNHKFDIILMDLNMPGINGIETSKIIAIINPDVTIIATTAVNEPADQQACLNAGMKGYLLKPFSEKDLFDALSAVITNETEPLAFEKNQQINLNELLHLANGDLKFLNEMIRLFIQSEETGIAKIEVAIKEEIGRASCREKV